MTDLEITRLCAEAIGWKYREREGAIWIHGISRYNPLEDDEQVMALVEKLKLDIEPQFENFCGQWQVSTWSSDNAGRENKTNSADLNRAICECVAKMQATK